MPDHYCRIYHKSDSSTREELEKERGSADEVTIRGTSDTLLNLPTVHQAPIACLTFYTPHTSCFKY